MIYLQERLKHWSTGYKTVNQGDSLAYPFENMEGAFKGDVLEVGPGEGRQAEKIMPLPEIKSYSIADIVQAVLDQPLFSTCKHKILIENWRHDFNIRFDVIHFWYVLHHVPRVEAYEFVSFLHRHMNKDGMVIFNTPYLDYDSGNYDDNGVLTTSYSIADVVRIFNDRFFCLMVDGSQYTNSNGHVYIGKRREL